MSLCFLALGSSNTENSLFFLNKAIEEIKKEEKVLKISSVFKTTALYKNSDFCGLKYYNSVISIDTKKKPEELLSFLQKIEFKIAKKKHNNSKKLFLSRDIDIDILLFENLEIDTENLTIPHYDLENRSFFLDPLCEIYPEHNILKRRKLLPQKQSLLMSIINFTEDSFSDGNIYFTEDSFSDGNIYFKEESFRSKIKNEIALNSHIIDIGCQSTAPNRIINSEEEEILRFKKIIPIVKEEFLKIDYPYLLPKISIDTFRSSIINYILSTGLEIQYINDVSGLDFDERGMIEIMQNNQNIELILMHNLSVPSNKNIIFNNTDEMMNSMKFWLDKKLNILEKNKIGKNRIIFDVGIGFGKTANQSLFLLENIEEFYSFGLRTCVGHSRKSFINSLSRDVTEERDIETLGVSSALIKKGVDILRVHNSKMHSDFISCYLPVMGYKNSNLNLIL